jgi:hypothetical protein
MTGQELIARQLAGAPVDVSLIDTLPEPVRAIAQRVASANGAGPLGAFEMALSECIMDARERDAFRRGVFAIDPLAESATDDATRTDALPQIVVSDRQLRDVSDEAISALQAANTPPVLFVRGGELARIHIDEQDKARIERMNEFSLRGMMTRAADFVRVSDKGGETSVPPPLDVVRDVLTLGVWPFPGLTGLIESPALRPDGSVITEPGYDRATGLYYRPSAALNVPPIPDNPTRAEIAEALALLREPFCDFPYVAEADRTNALALLLTPLLRPAIPGPVPLALVGATQQGTGKGLHAEIVSIVATGRAAVMAPMTKDEELQKQLYANLLAGEPLITFDNVDGRIYSPALARALTASEFGGRILGESRAPGMPQRATWIATGNAIQLGGDLARRCYPINLDAKMSQPWQRTGFRHPDLLEWVRAHRGRLIAAALTLARGWYAAGRTPAQSPVIGSFESWCRIVGGVLEYAGAGDFLGNLRAMYETADEESRQWEAFILALAAKFTGSVTVAEVCRAIEQDAALQDVTPDIGEEPLSATGTIRPKFKQILGFAFRKRIGRRHGTSAARIERGPTDTGAGAARWAFNHEVKRDYGNYGISTTNV